MDRSPSTARPSRRCSEASPRRRARRTPSLDSSGPRARRSGGGRRGGGAGLGRRSRSVRCVCGPAEAELATTEMAQSLTGPPMMMTAADADFNRKEFAGASRRDGRVPARRRCCSRARARAAGGD